VNKRQCHREKHAIPSGDVDTSLALTVFSRTLS